MWGSSGNDDGEFSLPSRVTAAPDGTVYVADAFNFRIQRFTATGTFLDTWGLLGSGDGQFGCPPFLPPGPPPCGPNGLAVATDGTIYAADTWNHRIQRFSSTGEFLGKWGLEGSDDGQLSAPSGVALAPDGTVYVADTLNHRIQRFSASGDFLGTWGIYGDALGQFFWPNDVAVAPDGTIYVADAGNHRIQAFGMAYPTTWRGEYFANRWLTGSPLAVTSTAQVDFDWGASAPDPALPADGFSARFHQYLSLTEGEYQFTVQAKGGVRLWVAGTLIVDQWDGLAETHTTTLSLPSGEHRVRLEYNNITGPAAVQLRWTRLTRLYLPAILVSDD